MNKFKSGGGFGGFKKGGDFGAGFSGFSGGRDGKSRGGYEAKKSFGGKSYGDRDDRGGDRGDRNGRGSSFSGGSRGGFGGSRDDARGGVEMYKATCSNCAKSCEVPFRPNGEKPVFCRDCFASNRSDGRFTEERAPRTFERKFDAPRVDSASSQDVKALQLKVATLEGKVSEILSLMKGASEKVAAPVVEVAEIVSAPEKVAKKTVAKKVAVKKAPAKKVAAKKVAKK